MIKTKNLSSIRLFRYILSLFFLLIFSLCTSIKPVFSLSHEWVGVPKGEFGEQLWDKKSLKRNADGSVRVLSKFIPKTKSEITQDIMYTMDINCFEKTFRDVDVYINEVNSNLNNFAEWQDPNGDKLILGIIGQVCRFED